MFQRKTSVWMAITVAIVIVSGSAVMAQTLPLGLNLGFTSFMDGGPPAGPGFYYQQYLQWYSADSYRNADGHKISFPDIDAIVSLNQFLYQSDQPVLFGGKWGLDVIIPVVGIDSKGMGVPFTENDAGLGDLLVGPYLQWDPIMGDNGPKFMHRVELQTVFPTGKYDNNDAFNPGHNVYQLNPYWAATYWITPQWTATTRIHYLWCSENDDPWVGLPPGTNDVQPGQAIHLNFATSYELIPKQLRVGVNGYFLRQLEDAQRNGSDMNDSKEQVFAIGPGAMYSFSQDDHIFVNMYFETAAENRPEGFKLILRWTHHF